MSPLAAALLLFAMVRRHLQVLRLRLDEAYLAGAWGFAAQQAVEKLLRPGLWCGTASLSEL